MSCAEGLVKLILFAVNLIFALTGLGLIVLGALSKVNFDNYNEAIPEDYQNIQLAPILTIAIGSIIFIIAFFGCCGAIRESPCLLTTYAVILLLIFLTQLAIGIFAFLEIKDDADLKSRITNSINKLFNAYGNKEKSELVDLIQREFECCGVKDSTYWTQKIPDSCYRPDGKEIFKHGCADEFYDFMKDSANLIGIVVLSLSAIEVVTAVFSLCLSSSINNRERRFRY